MRASIAVLAALAALAFALGLGAWLEGAAGVPLPRATPGADSSALAAEAPASRDPEPPRRQAASSVPPEPTGRVPESKGAAEAPIEIQGRLLLDLGEGELVPAADAWLKLQPAGPSWVSGRRLRVVDGSWSLTAPAGGELEVVSAEQPDGPRLLPGEPRRFRVDADAEVTLKAHRAVETRIKVFAEDSGGELGDLEVAWVLEPRLEPPPDWPHDRRRHGYRRRTASPFRLMPRSLVHCTYEIRAPGYAWHRLDIDPTRGGERELVLLAGGDLTVKVRGRRRGGNWLRVRDGEGCPITERRPPPTIVRGLPPGSHRVTIESGEPDRNPLVHASGTALIQAGEMTTAWLQAAEEPAAVPVPMAGTLVVPEAWGLEEIDLVITFLDRPVGPERRPLVIRRERLAPVKGERGTWRWDAGRVQPGLYHLRVEPSGLGAYLMIPAWGNPELRVEIPPPGELTLRLLDGATDHPIDGKYLCWFLPRPPGERSMEDIGRSSKREGVLVRAAARGLFRFRAPEGEIHVWAQAGPRYPSRHERVMVAKGQSSATLRLMRRTAVAVRLLDRGEPLPCEVRWNISARSPQGGGPTGSTGRLGDARMLDLPAPGRYAISIQRLEGHPTPPVTWIDVSEGEIVELELELRPGR